MRVSSFRRPAVFALIVGLLVLPAERAGAQQIDLPPIIVEGARIGVTDADIEPSVSVLAGDDVDNGKNRDLRDATEGIPNVVYEEGPYLPSIRGVDGSAGVEAATAITAGTQPRVPIIVDGVSIPTSLSATTSITGIWDTSVVEVARGPQATTSGRNAIGGAIRVFTNDPVFDVEGALRAGTFSQDGTYTGALLFNTPLVADTVAVRFAAEGSLGEAFVEPLIPFQLNLANEIEEERLGRARGKVLITPQALPGLSLLASIDHQHLRTTFDPGAVDRNQTAYIFSDPGPIPFGKQPLDKDQTSYSIDIKQAFSERFEFEQKFAYLDTEVQLLENGGFAPLSNFDTDKKISDTLFRFRDLGPIKRGFIGFAYEAQTEKITDDRQLVDGEIDNKGVFGEVEIDLPYGFSVLLGGRYEIDDRSRDIRLFDSQPLPGFLVPGFALSATTEEQAFLPKIGFRYDVTPDHRVGYTYSEGFRAGGIDFNIFSGPPFFLPGPPAQVFEPEFLKNHEVFAKGRISPQFSYGVTGFFYTFKDIQLPGADPAAPVLISNLPEAQGYGAEFEASYEILPGLTLSGGIGLLETEITDGGTSGFEGLELPRAPNVTANANLTYRMDNGLEFSADLRHVGSQIYRLGTPRTPLDAYTVVDLGMGYETTTPDGLELRVDAYVKNATDAFYITRDISGGGIPPNVSAGRPRTFGLTATARF
ncbi:MAG: TonB-dependent receptor [Pseudomonadota bacterium]